MKTREYNREVMTKTDFNSLLAKHGDGVTLMIQERGPKEKVTKNPPFRKGTRVYVIVNGVIKGRVMLNVTMWHVLTRRYRQPEWCEKYGQDIYKTTFWKVGTQEEQVKDLPIKHMDIRPEDIRPDAAQEPSYRQAEPVRTQSQKLRLIKAMVVYQTKEGLTGVEETCDTGDLFDLIRKFI